MNSVSLLLLTWLHNIYMKPNKFCTLHFQHHAPMINEILESEYAYSDSRTCKLKISLKGKKLLLANLHLLIDDEYFHHDNGATANGDGKLNYPTISEKCAVVMLY